MDQRILQFEQKHRKRNPPDPRPGDTVKVHQLVHETGKERIQLFEGVVIARKHGSGMSGSFTVRKIGSDGIAIERTFPIHLPTIVKVERLKTAKTRRAKLYYLRDRVGGGLKLKGEKRAPLVWEEPMAEEELEKIHKDQEATAATREEQRKKQQDELDKKFAQAKAQHDAGEQAAGSPGGAIGKTPPPDQGSQNPGAKS